MQQQIAAELGLQRPALRGGGGRLRLAQRLLQLVVRALDGDLVGEAGVGQRLRVVQLFYAQSANDDDENRRDERFRDSSSDGAARAGGDGAGSETDGVAGLAESGADLVAEA